MMHRLLYPCFALSSASLATVHVASAPSMLRKQRQWRIGAAGGAISGGKRGTEGRENRHTVPWCRISVQLIVCAVQWHAASRYDDAGRRRFRAADADGAAGEAAAAPVVVVIAGRRRGGGRRRRGVVAVGAVGVQGQGGADREAEDGGQGEGVRAPRPRRGGVQATRLHQAGAGGHGGPDEEGGGVHTEADRHGEPSAKASRQDLCQEGERVQRGPRGVQREEQGESAASQQVNRAGEREREDADEEARGAQQNSGLPLLVDTTQIGAASSLICKLLCAMD